MREKGRERERGKVERERERDGVGPAWVHIVNEAWRENMWVQDRERGRWREKREREAELPHSTADKFSAISSLSESAWCARR